MSTGHVIRNVKHAIACAVDLPKSLTGKQQCNRHYGVNSSSIGIGSREILILMVLSVYIFCLKSIIDHSTENKNVCLSVTICSNWQHKVWSQNGLWLVLVTSKIVLFSYLFLKYFGGNKSFLWATDTSVLDFWLCLP